MERQTKLIRWVLITSLAVPAITGQAVRGQYAGGSGTADDPYLIETAEQMNSIGLCPTDWDKHFQLMADIDMNDLGEARVNLIGTLDDPFEGVFDGNNHTIANLVYHVKDEDSPSTWSSVLRIGLFRVISGWDAMVKDLGLIEPDLRPDPNCTRPVDRMGALVGTLSGGWVRNCYVKGGQVLGRNDVGGVVGECYTNAAVSECWSTAEVSGHSSVGGLAGYAGWASIWWCHAKAHVSGAGNTGGLVGDCLAESSIEDCFSTGTVTGSQSGGLVGFLQGSVSRSYSMASVSGNFSLGGLAGVNCGLIHASWAGGEVTGFTQIGGLVGCNMVRDGIMMPYFDTQVTDCYATGPVRGNLAGGLIGLNWGATLLRCYSTGKMTGEVTGSVSGPSAVITVGGLVAVDRSVAEWDILGCFWDTMTSGVNKSAGGTGLTTAPMQDIATYLAAGWDFTGETANGVEDVWTMSADGPGYPKLAWEAAPDPNATH